jgi:hypothetical protein
MIVRSRAIVGVVFVEQECYQVEMLQQVIEDLVLV